MEKSSIILIVVCTPILCAIILWCLISRRNYINRLNHMGTELLESVDTKNRLLKECVQLGMSVSEKNRKIGRLQHRVFELEYMVSVMNEEKTQSKPFKNYTVNTDQQFSKDEIKKLIQLCHPDKHGGKPMAQEIIKKLIALR